MGFISSVTQAFCGDCSRARLSSDGSVLHLPVRGAGLSLRDPLRAGATDDELAELIRQIWTGRQDRYSELRANLREASGDHTKVEMYYIGG